MSKAQQEETVNSPSVRWGEVIAAEGYNNKAASTVYPKGYTLSLRKDLYDSLVKDKIVKPSTEAKGRTNKQRPILK